MGPLSLSEVSQLLEALTTLQANIPHELVVCQTHEQRLILQGKAIAYSTLIGMIENGYRQQQEEIQAMLHKKMRER